MVVLGVVLRPRLVAIVLERADTDTTGLILSYSDFPVSGATEKYPESGYFHFTLCFYVKKRTFF